MLSGGFLYGQNHAERSRRDTSFKIISVFTKTVDHDILKTVFLLRNKVKKLYLGEVIMRKTWILFVILFLVFAVFPAVALEAQPGDTVQIPITLNNTDGCYVKIIVSYDTNVFEYGSISCNNGQAMNLAMTMLDVNTLPSGVCGTLTLKVKSGAVNGTYAIGASVVECWDFNEQPGTASASAASVTITGGVCLHGDTSWTTVHEATCTAAGERAEKCSACGETVNTEEIPAAGHDEGTWSTVKEATCTEAGEKVLKCGKCSGTIKMESIPAA